MTIAFLNDILWAEQGCIAFRKTFTQAIYWWRAKISPTTIANEVYSLDASHK